MLDKSKFLKFKIWIILFFFILLFSNCRSSTEASFENLKDAFVDWYFRYHPLQAIKYNINLNGSLQLNSKSEIDEYYADVSRFLIELSQIDITKISNEARLEYDILHSNLNKIKFTYDVEKPWEWNPLWEIDKLYESLYVIGERNDIKMEERVNSTIEILTNIPKFLENSKLLKTRYSEVHFNYCTSKINKILLLLDQIPLKLNSDNIILDKIDILINSSILALKSYLSWINNFSNLEKANFPIDFSLINEGFSIYAGRYYKSEVIYKMASKKLINTQNKMFSISLPVYLEYNDEPVWLDREDTLEVIKWTLNDIYKDANNNINNSKILSSYYSSLLDIEKFVNNKSIFSIKNNKEIRLQFAPNYSLDNEFVYLFDDHPKDFSREIIYNIKFNEYQEIKYGSIKQEIDILNAANIIPGRVSQLSYAQKHPSMIRYLFPDLITQYGWRFYALNTFIDLGYGDYKHKLLKLREELIIIAMAIFESKFYSDKLTRDDVHDYFSKIAFIKNNKIDLIQKKLDLNYFYGTLSFIGLMELNSLKLEYYRKDKDKFTLSDFHDLVLSDGVIPISYLKKKF